MKAAQILNGKFGRTWVNSELWAEIESFEAKVTGKWEDVEFCEELGTQRKYMGYSIEGTMSMKKMHSRGANLLDEGFRTGLMPDVKLVSRLADPAAYGHERVEITGVTFDEMTLIKYTNGELGKEDLPFKAVAYRYIDKIK